MNLLGIILLLVAQAGMAQSYRSIFKPLPNPVVAKTAAEKAKLKLGQMLFHETKLSIDGKISCNSCHALDNYGVDGEQFSTGFKNQKGGRNSPTVYNAYLHIAQFWDGRAKDVEEQALGPILNPVEMAMPSAKAVVDVLKKDTRYKNLFTKAFPNQINSLTYKNVGNAIGYFERTLVTPSRFDAYLKGDDKAITPAEKAGLHTFVTTGCIACHIGTGIGGSMYQKLGLVKPYQTKDLGRFEVTKNEADKYFFKVPSLRNVAKTAPYLHDGSLKTLDQTVRVMAEYQLGRKLDDKKVTEIVTFLNALTADKKTLAH